MRRLLICLLPLFCLFSCYTSYRTISTVQNFSDSVTFKINRIEEGYSISTGKGFFYPSRGNKFIFIYISFTNLSSDKQDLNFHNVYIIDNTTQTKYKVEFSMLTSLVNIWGRVDSNIAAKNTKSRKLVFNCPEHMKAEYLLVNDRKIKIEYAN